MAPVTLGMSITDPRDLSLIDSSATPDVATLATLHDVPELVEWFPTGTPLQHIYFGSEFCEHLFPEQADLQHAIECACRLQLKLVLATPIANDALVERILDAATRLPSDAEILVNDWGVAHALLCDQPKRKLVAGRQLARMLKEPRATSPAWSAAQASGYATPEFRDLLASMGMGHLELDVPPFAAAATFETPGLAVSVWLPIAYVAKGRICKAGSLQQPAHEKFFPGVSCHRECLGLREEATHASRTGVHALMRGNTYFYRQTPAMLAVVRTAMERGLIDRLVLSRP